MDGQIPRPAAGTWNVRAGMSQPGGPTHCLPPEGDCPMDPSLSLLSGVTVGSLGAGISCCLCHPESPKLAEKQINKKACGLQYGRKSVTA